MNKKILVTGGPVHGFIDAVKIVTNRFKGGRIAGLAEKLGECNTVAYLTSKDGKFPQTDCFYQKGFTVYHEGFEDYKKKVLQYAGSVDAMILGAAVCNLLPQNPWKGKFPSHNYKPGDVINIPFVLTPRVINEVRKVNPKVQLFGFKLLSNVPFEELISAAYEVVLDSGATAVFANDAANLDQKWAVTKERAIIPLSDGPKGTGKPLHEFIEECLNDEYYHTRIVSGETPDKLIEMAETILSVFEGHFPVVQGGHVFGTVAVKSPEGFLTTTRGKRELEDWAMVYNVDHDKREVTANKKASLNAPLLDTIFTQFPGVFAVIHYHENNSPWPKLPWAPPGTKRDSVRSLPVCDIRGREHWGFEIEHHGVFHFLKSKNNV